MAAYGKIGMAAMVAALGGCNLELELCNFSDETVEFRYFLEAKGENDQMSVTLPPGDCTQVRLEPALDEDELEIIVIYSEGELSEDCDRFLPESGANIRVEWDGVTLDCFADPEKGEPPAVDQPRLAPH